MSIASIPAKSPAPVQLAAVGQPQPQEPPPPPPAPGQNLPTPDQLSSNMADHHLRKAYRNGNFPEQFSVTNIQPAGPNAATADVAISGPKFAGPVTKNLAFVNEGGNWILQHDSALALLQAAAATG